MAAERGGLKVTWAVPSPPGRSESVVGSTTLQALAGPSTDRVISSITEPVLRTVAVRDASPPTATSSEVADNSMVAPMGEDYPAQGHKQASTGRPSGTQHCPL